MPVRNGVMLQKLWILKYDDYSGRMEHLTMLWVILSIMGSYVSLEKLFEPDVGLGIKIIQFLKSYSILVT